MPSQRIIWTGIAEATTTPSILVDDESLRIREYNWHLFLSGTFSGASVQVQYSPDLQGTPDGSSTWYSPATLLFTTGGDMWFAAKPRKFRVAVTGGTGSTSINLEIR